MGLPPRRQGLRRPAVGRQTRGSTSRRRLSGAKVGLSPTEPPFIVGGGPSGAIVGCPVAANVALEVALAPSATFPAIYAAKVDLGWARAPSATLAATGGLTLAAPRPAECHVSRHRATAPAQPAPRNPAQERSCAYLHGPDSANGIRLRPVTERKHLGAEFRLNLCDSLPMYPEASPSSEGGSLVWLFG